jgi:large subunit ribosomal protein L22
MAKQATPKIQEVKAFARFIHMSPRKLRLVADLIRRARVDVALEQLRYSSKNAALPITKLLNSAIANAVHNFSMNREDLVVKAITVDGGPVMKRMLPRAQGRADIMKRRMAHINLILESRPKTKSKKSRSIFTRTSATPATDAAKPVNTEVEEGKVDQHQDKPKAVPKNEQALKKQTSTQKRRLFNRKSGE